MKPDPLSDADRRRLTLSALLDGERDAADDGCALWRDDPQARRDWHRWNLIGDAMRSAELATPPARDAEFLARLRERLADEPVVVAPAPLASAPAAPRRRARWMVPAATAAGFVAAAAAVVVLRVQAPDPAAGPVMASGAAPAAGVLAVRGGPPASGAREAAAPDGTLIRDARLDSYLRAHRDMRGAAIGVPGGALRSVDVTVPDR